MADTQNHCIRKITTDGIVSTIAGNRYYGWFDGPGNLVQFMHPTGIALDSAGNIYVTELDSKCIRKVFPDDVVKTIAGKFDRSEWVDGCAYAARFTGTRNTAVDKDGNMYACDSWDSVIRKITSGPR